MRRLSQREDREQHELIPGLPERPELPDSPGTYLLGLEVIRPVSRTVGALGVVEVPPGVLIYVGSALGPGGLRARLGRHLFGGGKLRWHIDYLREICPPVAAWWQTGRTRREHAWARALLRLDGARVLRARFGASDCACESHLVWLPSLTGEPLGPRARLARWPA